MFKKYSIFPFLLFLGFLLTSFINNPYPVISKNNWANETVLNSSILKMTNVYFEKDDVSLTEKEKNKINTIVTLTLKYSQSRILIEGHADRTSDVKDGQKLSADRAASVKKYLTNQGINPDIMETVSLGASQPMSTDESENGSQLNRRAKIVLYQF